MNTRLLLALIGGMFCFATTAAATEPAVRGTFQLDGKSYSLSQGVAYPAKVFDEMGTTIFLSDRAIPIDRLKSAIEANRGSDSQFFIDQPHVKITFTKNGKVNFAVLRSAGTSTSAGGDILTGDVTVKEGRAIGKATLVDKSPTGIKDAFDLTFDVALLTINVPAEEPEAKLAKPAHVKQPKSGEPRDAVTNAPKTSDPKHPAASGKTDNTQLAGAINAHDLPIPSDATKVDFGKTVKMLHFESALDYRAMVEFLQTKLPAQGWAADGDDLVAKKSAILKRTQGEAKLTIFVKPTAAGSKVTVMTEHVSFEDK